MENFTDYNNFDWKMYLRNYSDLSCKIKNKHDAWKHWINHGQKENRNIFLLEKNDKNEHLIKKIEKKAEKAKAKAKAKAEKAKAKAKAETEETAETGKAETEKAETGKVNEKTNILNNLIEEENPLVYYDENTNIVLKTTYSNYGTHYYGWKGVINQLIPFLSKDLNCKDKIFLDEWIEKLFLWGDKIKNASYLKEIKNNNYKVCTFIHNPPYDKLKKDNTDIHKDVIFNENLLNDNLFNVLQKNNLTENIEYIYALSNNHKKYLYNHYPLYKNRLLSVYHPIEINKNKDNLFDFNCFMENKRVIHIGWWLRNFKTFIDLVLPESITKHVLVKSDFKKQWGKMSLNYDLSSINVLNELTSDKYEKIFTNSCMFMDLEDAVATNVILECIRFSTPVIVNKNPSTVEYLGENYPLYFSEKEELEKFKSYVFFNKSILNAHMYLLKMDKTHIKLKTFNTKIWYDLNKLSINNDNKLTWFCLIENETDVNHIDSFVCNFLNQENYNELKLTFIVNNKGCDFEKIQTLKNYENISFVCTNIPNVIINYGLFLNVCIQNTFTTFLTIANLTDTHEPEYSKTIINYFIQNPTSDIVYVSFKINETYEITETVHDKNTLLFHDSVLVLSDTGTAWRKSIHTLEHVDYFKNECYQNTFQSFWKKCIENHLNIYCASDKVLYTKFVH
jgi:hypothetical protein